MKLKSSYVHSYTVVRIDHVWDEGDQHFADQDAVEIYTHNGDVRIRRYNKKEELTFTLEEWEDIVGFVKAQLELEEQGSENANTNS